MIEIALTMLLSSFNPEPNDPPKSSGGSGTRLEKVATVNNPKDCPPGTAVVLPNEDGTFQCFK